MKNQTSMETMQRLASQMDGLSIASRGLRSAIRPAKKIVALPKRVQREKNQNSNSINGGLMSHNGAKEEVKSNITISNYRSVTDSAICSENGTCSNSCSNSYEEEEHAIHEKFSKNDPKYLDLYQEDSLDQSDSSDSEISTNQTKDFEPRTKIEVKKVVTFDQSKNSQIRPSENTSGYGSETSAGTGSSDSSAGNRSAAQKNGIETEFNDESGSSGVENGAHCVRCHKMYDPNSKSTAELRCSLPHPTKSVIPIKRDAFGTDFVCLCCRTEFRLPKMAFYEAGVNSMLTGFCFIGQHTQDASEIDYQQDGGAALCCEEAGCIEYFV
jgi:hypothetical protein